jgi:hypothetical protein
MSEKNLVRLLAVMALVWFGQYLATWFVQYSAARDIVFATIAAYTALRIVLSEVTVRATRIIQEYQTRPQSRKASNA